MANPEDMDITCPADALPWLLAITTVCPNAPSGLRFNFALRMAVWWPWVEENFGKLALGVAYEPAEELFRAEFADARDEAVEALRLIEPAIDVESVVACAPLIRGDVVTLQPCHHSPTTWEDEA